MTDKAKPKRRFFRYSLRTLMLVVTVFCVWLGIISMRARDQRLAVEAIEELGGKVIYEHQFGGQPVVTKSGYIWEGAGPSPGPAWLRRIVGDEYFFTVTTVYLKGSKFTDASLEAIKRLRSFERLTLHETAITDEALVELRQEMPNLQISN